ncbi:MAG: patatin-like phospholipase family protein [Actinomycetota bacterium]|nr:patatin-like phospholipase family protein [Actinomycetota bacterium]
MQARPDILVLGGGGRQGDAWMTGVLAGLEDARSIDFAKCDYLVGTSAGSIVAAKLISGRRLKRPAAEIAAADPDAGGERPPLAETLAEAALRLAAPLAGAGLRLGALPGELARSTALALMPSSGRETLDFTTAFPPDTTRFDGRLRVVAVDRRAGKRVVFGAPGAPEATVAEAVRASCALPFVFGAALIGGREYVDGATWTPTNADAAPAAQGAQVLILAPMASLHGPFVAALRAASRTAMLLEVAALRARGAQVRTVTPDRASAAAIGADLMADKGLDDTHAAGYAQGLGL